MSPLFGPALLALCLWHQAGRRVPHWVAHLLYLPLVLLLAWMLGNLLFFAVHGNDQGPPGLGPALVPVLAMLIGLIVLYYGAVAACAAGALLRWLRDRRTGGAEALNPDR